MTLILDLLRDAFEEVKLPPSVYESKKIINKLGLNYTKIDACPNDCTLYLGDGEKDLDACKHCGKSIWKPNKKNKVATKVLRYFSLKPRLERLFRCCKTAKHMRWHASESNKDGLIRHPRDGEAWKTFNLMHPNFASDPRNVRLGLATDGFNPFGTLSSTYIIWPVFLTPYNLPPWIGVERAMDDGVETFDSSSNKTFRMRASLIWTISEFPGLGILSDWNTHTGLTCPTCNFDAEPCRLPHNSKWCFMGHRRFLSRNHRFRLIHARFDGSTKERNPLSKLSQSDILRQVENINVTIGKGAKLWSKSKDNLQARKDLREMGIRSDLWPNDNNRYNLAWFSVTRDNKKLFLKALKNVTVPDGYTKEARLGGPVHYRYMNPVERELGYLKSFVRYMAQPEGSIAECYLVEESLNFCSRYIEDIETMFNRPRHVRDDLSDKEPLFVSSIFPQVGKPIGASSMFTFT
ncbi:PREDICTED: uncharacterized protein LOC109350568 [Lupinus angustifolius]|uniref:uncharacterized protein LOC109350568 n=1 Tax=Lupinus angustifolius TaxID=3871 RepID=UPI00092E5EF6|nr:PREDICTED: uncharacterized protein LOC109350568 [Lupinus angustifolius]